MKRNTYITLIITICFYHSTAAQEKIEYNAFNEVYAATFEYNFDSLLVQLEKWRSCPYIKIDSIGASVMGRAIWMLTIRGKQNHFLPIYRVTIHARTHPNEIQSEMLTHRMIEYLIEDSEFGELLRDRFEFNIVPMYNPDGVELGYGRQNANKIDLERNWFTNPPEPEVNTIRNKYREFMESFLPISIMLNMHGDSGAEKNYFVFHHENGTSDKYVEDQKKFYSAVSKYYSNGIAAWDYSVTWKEGNPLTFPESWFWVNYAEDVMALTFEKIPTQTANDVQYDSTAYALLKGIVDYFNVTSETNITDLQGAIIPNAIVLYQNYPNPFNASTIIRFSLPVEEFVKLEVYDALGNLVTELLNEELSSGIYQVEFSTEGGDGYSLSSGIYYYKLTTKNFMQVKKLVLIK